MIYIYNKDTEKHAEANAYPTYEGVLANPYTLVKTRGIPQQYIVKTEDEAILKYSRYFDIMYSGNSGFINLVDEIYTKYRNGEDIYLGFDCLKPNIGNVIKKKLEKRLLKEQIEKIRKDNENIKERKMERCVESSKISSNPG